MTTLYEKRQQSKAFNKLAREVAKTKLGAEDRVAFNAEVQRVEEGAYVEARIWVSKNDLETAALDGVLEPKDLKALSDSVIDSLPEQ
jgi:hypothetical protein